MRSSLVSGMVKDDVNILQSILKNSPLKPRETKLGPEDITRDIPNIGEEALS